MAKTKTAFFCKNCGNESPKWMGKCISCGEWNTYTEEIKPDKKATNGKADFKGGERSTPKKIKEISAEDSVRMITPDEELNRVLGGGIVAGSLVLIGGEPGIGKSTLMLQLSVQFSGLKALYISGEESEHQIKMRAERIGIKNEDCYILSETSIQKALNQAEAIKPDVLIIDSIQTMFHEMLDSAPGSITQVRESAGLLMKYAKQTGTPVFLIGHINKEGSIAGPKVLEHMVDTVLQFEGDRNLAYRLLRNLKNRFGSTAEIGIYEMDQKGLHIVTNPSEILITQRDEKLSGVAIAASQEGNRPLLVEIQSLVSPATYGTPQRTATGFDQRRLNMLLAVLEKRGGFKLGIQDVFLNIAGGLKVEDPAIDLAVCASIVSSFHEIPMDDKWCLAGEIGLGGEVRAVKHIEARISEAKKMGFNKMIISKYNKLPEGVEKGFTIETVGRLDDVFAHLFG